MRPELEGTEFHQSPSDIGTISTKPRGPATYPP